VALAGLRAARAHSLSRIGALADKIAIDAIERLDVAPDPSPSFAKTWSRPSIFFAGRPCDNFDRAPDFMPLV
jgi:hypothetical protein